MMRGGKSSLAVLLCALLSTGTAGAGTANDDPDDRDAREEIEELVVRGRKPSELRAAVEAARIRVYEVFNELNGDDAFDVHCRSEAATGRRMPRQVCRPRFRDDISSASAAAFQRTLKETCGSASQECIFANDFAASVGLSRAQAEEAREGPMQQLFEREFERVMLEHPELQQAILDYEAAEQALQESLRRRRRN